MKKFKIGNDWDNLLWNTVDKPYLEKLNYNLKVEQHYYVVYPEVKDFFRAFQLTPFKDVRVILCGEEPYNKPNMADGLSYSSFYNPSLELINLFRKIEDELKIRCDFNNFDLSRWAHQGVLLLNLNLSVRAGQEGSHQYLNWNLLTYNAIKLLYNDTRPKVFLLLGNTYRVIDYVMQEEKNHLVITGPSPAYPPFFKRNYFQNTNDFLSINYGKKIDWR